MKRGDIVHKELYRKVLIEVKFAFFMYDTVTFKCDKPKFAVSAFDRAIEQSLSAITVEEAIKEAQEVIDGILDIKIACYEDLAKQIEGYTEVDDENYVLHINTDLLKVLVKSFIANRQDNQ